MAALTVPEFVARWEGATLRERAGSQSHFNDLCDVLGQPKPTDLDQEGSFYTFERGAAKAGGVEAWAEVWFKGRFGWEYKGKHKDLVAALRQLQQYRDALENPPLLVGSDMDRFEVHTAFTNATKRTYSFALADLLNSEPIATTHGLPALEVLRALWTDPERLRPEEVTEQAARPAHFPNVTHAHREKL